MRIVGVLRCAESNANDAAVTVVPFPPLGEINSVDTVAP